MTREEWSQAFDETRRFIRKVRLATIAGNAILWLVIIFIVWRLL